MLDIYEKLSPIVGQKPKEDVIEEVEMEDTIHITRSSSRFDSNKEALMTADDSKVALNEVHKSQENKLNVSTVNLKAEITSKSQEESKSSTPAGKAESHTKTEEKQSSVSEQTKTEIKQELSNQEDKPKDSTNEDNKSGDNTIDTKGDGSPIVTKGEDEKPKVDDVIPNAT